MGFSKLVQTLFSVHPSPSLVSSIRRADSTPDLMLVKLPHLLLFYGRVQPHILLMNKKTKKWELRTVNANFVNTLELSPCLMADISLTIV